MIFMGAVASPRFNYACPNPHLISQPLDYMCTHVYMQIRSRLCIIIYSYGSVVIIACRILGTL